MEKTKIAKIENVTLCRRGDQVSGTLHLTPHHLIFSHIPPVPAPAPLHEVSPKESPQARAQSLSPSQQIQPLSRALSPAQQQQQQQQHQPPAQPPHTRARSHPRSQTHSPVPAAQPRELWITYPIISNCVLRLPSPASRVPATIRLRCRDFTFVCFYFPSEVRARETYDTVRHWTCRIGRVERLYAFVFAPQGPERACDGWALYDARREWARMGVGSVRSKAAWRISTINADYTFCPTYPTLLPVPLGISDNTINHAGKHRSRGRIPVLTYLHPVNNCSITRSSQPLVGLGGNRSIQDEKLLAAIFDTSSPEQNRQFPPPLETQSSQSSGSAGEGHDQLDQFEIAHAEELEDQMISATQGNGDKKHVYGAQQHNLIVDARPTVNAVAMKAMGRGSERMENYKCATKVYLGIPNIHAMRDSLDKVVEALKDSDISPLGPSRDLLAKSGWLRHITAILDGTALVARQVGLQHSHVLIHCSDGWDRTGQLSALSQLCLDPYYRTLEGFMVLVEKDWLSFGHMFRYRAGLLNSQQWFQVENDRSSSDNNPLFGEGNAASKAIENALWSARGLFNREPSITRESMGPDSEDSDDPGSRSSEAEVTNTKELSPVFHQFLDATYQLLYQHPTRFEFNERFLRRLLYHLYSCQYGTFLFNSEKERVDMRAKERTRSVWDYFLSRREQFLNPKYDPVIDDNQRGRERLLFPHTGEVRWWPELFGRTDAEMNGERPVSVQALREQYTTRRAPVLTGFETANHSLSAEAVQAEQNTRSAQTEDGRPTQESPQTESGAASSGMAALTAGLASFGLSTGRERPEQTQEMPRVQEMEVEMK